MKRVLLETDKAKRYERIAVWCVAGAVVVFGVGYLLKIMGVIR